MSNAMEWPGDGVITPAWARLLASTLDANSRSGEPPKNLAKVFPKAVHEKLTLTFLECGELVSSANHCLERVACLYTTQGNDSPGGFSKQERDVVSM